MAAGIEQAADSSSAAANLLVHSDGSITAVERQPQLAADLAGNVEHRRQRTRRVEGIAHTPQCPPLPSSRELPDQSGLPYTGLAPN